MAKGFVYLVAIMDWSSRKVLSWRLSNTMDTDFCIDALEEAIARYGAPEIFNTDQGAQFTSSAFTGVLKAHDIQISMDGKGRWIDNVFIERLWRSVKYEEVYLHAYDSVNQTRSRIGRYLEFYNSERKHQSLGMTPDQAYFGETGLQETADYEDRRHLSGRPNFGVHFCCVFFCPEKSCHINTPAITFCDQVHAVSVIGVESCSMTIC